MRERLRTMADVFASAARNRSLRRVELAYGLFIGAEWAVWISLLVYAYERGGTTDSALIAVVQLVPSAVLGPVVGTLADRVRPGRVLLLGYGTQALSMGGVAAAIGAGAPAWVVYVLAPVVCMGITVTRPAQAALLPSVVRTPDELTASNVVTGWVEQAGKLVVPAIAGVLLDVSGPGLAIAATAGMTLASGLLVRPVPGPPGVPAGATVAGTVRANLSEAWRHPATRLVLSLDLFYQSLIGALDLLAVVLAVSVLGLGRGGAGYLNAAVAAGGIAAGAVTAFMVGRHGLSRFLVAGILGATVSLALVATRPGVAGAFVLLAAVGFSGSVFDVTAMTLLQRIAPSDALAGFFSLRESLMDVGLGMGVLIVEIGVWAGGYRVALVIPAALAVVLVAASWRGLRAIDHTGVVPQVEIHLLRSIPIFRGLPAPALEGVARSLSPVRTPAGTVVVRAGDSGDRYYAVADGTLTVQRDGRQVAWLGRGDGFGEIALVHDVPRLATVTADTDCLLYELDKEPFVLVLTGHPAVARAARAVTAGHGVADTVPTPPGAPCGTEDGPDRSPPSPVPERRGTRTGER